MMRSGTTLLQRLLAADSRFHCAYGWEVVEAAPKLDYGWSAAEDPRIAISEKREATSRELAPELFAIHPMYAREPEEEIVFLSDAFLSHVPESGAHVPKYRSWIDGQDFTPAYAYLHRMLQFLQWQKRQAGPAPREAVGAEIACAPWLSRRIARPVSRPARRAHAPRPARDDPVGRQPQRHAARDARRRRRPRTASARSGSQRMGWTNDRAMATRDGWADEARGAPTSSSPTPSPIRSVRWPACTTRSACR